MAENGRIGHYRHQVTRDIPYSALQFMNFEYLKKRASPGQKLQSDKRFAIHLEHDLCIGAIAGAVACTLTTLLDVAQTRVMTQNPSIPVVHMGLQTTLQKQRDGASRSLQGSSICSLLSVL